MSGDNLVSANEARLVGEQQALSLSSSKSLGSVGAGSLAGPQTDSARPKTILGFALFYEDKDGNRVRGVLDDTDDIGADIADLPNRVFRRATSPTVSILRLSSSVISELPPRRINTPKQAVLSSPVMSRRHAVLEFLGDHRITVKDLGSLHGTYITRSADELGCRITPREPYDLRDGDLVTFGRPVNRSSKDATRRVEPARVRIRFLYEPESQNEMNQSMTQSEFMKVTDDAQAESATTSSVVLRIPPIRYLSDSPPSSSDDQANSNRVSSNRYGVFEVSRSPSPSSSVDMDEDYSDDPVTLSSSPNTSPDSRRHDSSGNVEDSLDLSRRLPSLRHLGLLNGKNTTGAAEHSAAILSSPFLNSIPGLLAKLPSPPPPPPPAPQWTSTSSQVQQEDDGASRSSSPMHLSSHEGSPEPVVVGAWPSSPHTRAERPRSPAAARSRSPSVMELPSPSPIPDPRSPLLRPAMTLGESPLDEDDDDVVEVPGPSLLVVEDPVDYGFSPERYNLQPDLLIDAESTSDLARELSPVLNWLEKLPELSSSHTTEQERNREMQKKLNDIHDGLKSFTKDRADIQATVKALRAICDNKFAFLERQGREILQAQEHSGDEHTNALARNIVDLQSLQDMEQHAKDLISALSVRTADISHKLHSMAHHVNSGIRDNSAQIEALRQLQSDFIQGFSTEIESIVSRLLAAQPQAPPPTTIITECHSCAESRRNELDSTTSNKRKRDEYEEEDDSKDLEVDVENPQSPPDDIPELPPSKRARVSDTVGSALSFTGIASFGALAMWMALAYY